jgi:SNF2 family DNA or RNA helicase
MGELLQVAIEQRFGRDVPFFHGGLSPRERENMLDAFRSEDGEPVLILSLKAGGTGLNLVRATAVIHYDRWWNPAVEDQATDRAHRIGQTRPVNVYKFVTTGTLEERIQRMLEEKRSLAAEVLSDAGETWVTEMSDRELRDFLKLEDSVEEGAEN